MQLTINPFLNTLEVFSEIEGKEVYTRAKYILNYYAIIQLCHGGTWYGVELFNTDTGLRVLMREFANDSVSVPFKLIIELNINQSYDVI